MSCRVWLLLLLFCAPLAAQSRPPEPRSLSEVLEDRTRVVEEQVVSAAEAMPEEKYSFLPAQGEFRGVRSFAEQVKHLAAANHQLAAAALGEEPPAGTRNETAPETVRTKAEILAYLKSSFAALHRASAVVRPDNVTATVPLRSRMLTRPYLINDALAHASDHYGQMVEYLRMNGIVPPASR